MSENTETVILAGGCFWPAQELLRRRDGVHLHPRRLHRRREREPDRSATIRATPRRSRSSSIPSGPPTGTSSSSSSRSTDPDQGPPGQVHRLGLPLRDLLYDRRAAPGRRGHDRRRRCLRPLARQGRHRDQRGRAPSGRPRPKTRTTSSATPTATISSVRSRTVRDSRLGRGGAARGHLAMRSTSRASGRARTSGRAVLRRRSAGQRTGFRERRAASAAISTQRICPSGLAELEAQAAVLPPGDGGVGAQVGLAQDR